MVAYSYSTVNNHCQSLYKVSQEHVLVFFFIFSFTGMYRNVMQVDNYYQFLFIYSRIKTLNYNANYYILLTAKINHKNKLKPFLTERIKSEVLIYSISNIVVIKGHNT